MPQIIAERDAARRRRRHRDDLVAAVRELDRARATSPCTPSRSAAVIMPLAALHLGDDELRGRALVEALRPLVGDALEHRGELRVLPGGAAGERLAARQEERRRGRVLAELAPPSRPTTLAKLSSTTKPSSASLIAGATSSAQVFFFEPSFWCASQRPATLPGTPAAR